MNDWQIRIPKRVTPNTAAAVLVLLFILVPAPRDAVGGALATAWKAAAVADPAALAAQRGATELAIARGYRKATDQLSKVRELRLPIATEEAERIQARTIQELQGVRRTALAAVAEAFGMAPTESDAYVRRVEPTLESLADTGEGALLAPKLYGIAARANELFTQTAERAIRQMTAPLATPSPSPTPRLTPPPSPTR